MRLWRTFSVLIISLAAALLFNSTAEAGTITAEINGTGSIDINADFSADFTCMPEGLTPSATFTEINGCYSQTNNSWAVSGDRRLQCPKKGKTWSYSASAAGGQYVGELCASRGSGPIYGTAMETEDIETTIIVPEWVPNDIVPVGLQYNFKYDNADTCTGQTPSRVVSLSYGGSASGLPVTGVSSFNYNFTGASGYTMLTAQSCCNGNCRTTTKFVYIVPELEFCSVNAGGASAGNGRTTASEQDFTLQGIMPMNFTRQYNSKNITGSEFGTRWSHPYSVRAISTGNSYRVINADGTPYYYTDNDGDKVYMPELPKGLKSRVIKHPNNTLVREYDDGSKEEFNTYGYMTAQTDRNGNRTTLTRDTGNKLTRITDPSGRQINITYSGSTISQITLPDGKTIGYTYYGSMLQKATYPDSTQRTYEYVSTNYLSGIKNENGQYVKKYTYDAQKRAITTSTDGINDKLTINYTSDTESTVTDSLGRVTTYTMAKTKGKIHPTGITGPGCSSCGQSNVSYTYDDNLNITSETDANGNITTYTHDQNSNMLTKTEAYGTALQRTNTYTYNSFGQVLTATDPDGNTTTNSYDTKGNLLSSTDAMGNATTFTYDPVTGLKTTMTDSEGHVTNYTYDQYGNLATVTNSLGHVTTYTYDVMGNLLSVIDANGNQTTYTYDLRKRLKQVIDSLNGTTTYTYDLAGNLTSLTDAKGNTTQYAYDNVNRLIRETTPLNKQRNYTYDSQSNLKTKTDLMGRTTTYTHDNSNRVTQISHPDGTQTTFSYDAAGNMTTASNANISYTLTHDSLKRLIAVTDSFGVSLQYAFDPNSNRIRLTDPLGTVTQYTYNPTNTIAAITDPFGHTTTYAYDTLGRRSSLTLPNAIATGYSYDIIGRLTGISSIPETIGYTYDNTGNRTSKTDTAGTHNYIYDPIYRLTQATHQNMPIEQYSYDAVGNRLNATVNAGNRLLEDSTYTYAYDDNGNMIQKTSKATGEITSYIFDTENRLIQVTRPGMTAEYRYDPFGRRIQKNINGTITGYIYDKEDILFETDAGGNVTTEYIHGTGTDEPIAMVRDGQKYYYHADALGSITAITDQNGNMVQKYEYDSFGNIVFVLTPSFIQPYTYTGREYDPETGMYYYRARYYDAGVGRFISEDPIGFKGGVNFYSYVGNNPVNYIDPKGLMGENPAKRLLCFKSCNDAIDAPNEDDATEKCIKCDKDIRKSGGGGSTGSIGPYYALCMRQWCKKHGYKGEICQQWK